MKVNLILILTVLASIELSVVVSKKDSRFQIHQKETSEAKNAPKRKIFDFIALEDASQPRNLNRTNLKNKRTRLVTFHLLNLNHTTRAPHLISKRRNATYIRPPTSYSYYRRGQNLKNESKGQLEQSVTNSSIKIHFNLDTKVNTTYEPKEIYNDKAQNQLREHFFNESNLDNNYQLESKQDIKITVTENNNTVPTQTEDPIKLATETSLLIGQVSFFQKAATTSAPIFLNISSSEIPLKDSTFNSTSVSINFFPKLNNSFHNTSETKISDPLYINTASVISSNITHINESSLLFDSMEILTTVSPSTSSSINSHTVESKALEGIPNHFKTAPISPARVASLLGFQQDSRSSIRNLLGNSGGEFLGFGDYGNFGGVNANDKSSSDLSFNNFGINFDLFGPQLGSQVGYQLGSQLSSQLDHQLGSQDGTQTESKQSVAKHQNPFLGGLAIDYLRQISNPKELESSQLNLAQTLSSLEALKPPSASSDLSAIGSFETHSGGSSSFPALNFNDFLGLGSLNFLQGQQIPLNQLNSESLLSSLSFSPQFSANNKVEALPAPQSESPLSSTVGQTSENVLKETDSKV